MKNANRQFNGWNSKETNEYYVHSAGQRSAAIDHNMAERLFLTNRRQTKNQPPPSTANNNNDNAMNMFTKMATNSHIANGMKQSATPAEESKSKENSGGDDKEEEATTHNDMVYIQLTETEEAMLRLGYFSPITTITWYRYRHYGIIGNNNAYDDNSVHDNSSGSPKEAVVSQIIKERC